jgi:hypothetical protein
MPINQLPNDVIVALPKVIAGLRACWSTDCTACRIALEQVQWAIDELVDRRDRDADIRDLLLTARAWLHECGGSEVEDARGVMERLTWTARSLEPKE